MFRTKRPPEPAGNHERWLVSYADFITLMFAFFVVMYATSQADKEKARQISEAVDKALSEGRFPSRIAAMLHPSGARPVPAKEQKIERLEPSLEELRNALREDIGKGRLDVRMEKRGLVISLRQAAFFPTGDATVAASGYESIRKVAATLTRVPNPIRLEGHTDSVPIRNDRFASNWHLSSARSIAMLDLLAREFGMPESRMAAVGYADTVPVDTNDTDQGRARNRRVDITVLNETSFDREPVGTARGQP